MAGWVLLHTKIYVPDNGQREVVASVLVPRSKAFLIFSSLQKRWNPRSQSSVGCVLFFERQSLIYSHGNKYDDGTDTFLSKVILLTTYLVILFIINKK